VLAVPEDFCFGEEETLGEEVSGGAAADEVDGGIEQQLQDGRREVADGTLLGDDRGEVAAG
jgi:hypothetical protein